jgi:hypothetical protein
MHSVSQTRLVALLALLSASCQTFAVAAAPQRIEVYIEGSDIETPENTATHELLDAIEKLISSRSDLSLANAGEGDVVVLIPEQVTLERASNNQRVLFAAEVTAKRDGTTRHVSGSCPRQTISKCAQMVVNALAS